MSTWWVQCTCTHVRVVYGYETRKVILILQVSGCGGGMEKEQERKRGGEEGAE